MNYTNFNSNQLNTLFNDLSTKKLSLIKNIKDIEEEYKKEKTAIEAKLISTTQLKQQINKNNKIETKIFNKSETKEEKIKYYDDAIKEYLSLTENKITNIRDVYTNKMEREIEILENKIREVRQKYENKIDIEIKEINTKSDTYIIYLERQKNMCINKIENQIKDISANIVESNIGIVLDEDNYPKLTKLKVDKNKLENNLKETISEMENINATIKIVELRERKYKEEERKEKERQDQLKEEIERRKKIEEYNIKKEKERKEEEEKKLIKKQEKEKEELKEDITKKWKETVYNSLPIKYKKYCNYVNKEYSDKIKTIFNTHDLIVYLDNISSEIDNYISLKEYYYNEDSKIADEFCELSIDQQFEISNKKDKIQQNYLIKKYFKELRELQEQEKEIPLIITS